MDLTDSLKTYVEDRLSRVNKFTDFNLNADIFLGVEKHRKHIHATIKGNGFFLNSEAEDPANMYKAIDLCVDKLEKQLRRGKYTHSDKKKGKEVERENIISKHRVLDQDMNLI